ncbi:MAG: flagellar basal body rod protein FlgB [Planctomycetes bacterium]|nr:flagellar basal body rod protein FlgB [Planctomycetota bacterium]
MFFNDVANSGSIPAMEAMLSFTQARHKMLAENIANIDTPGYRPRHLDPKAFQHALASAVRRRREDGLGELPIESTRQFEREKDGSIRFKPVEEPAENVLFHDQTNASVERQMSKLAENAMMHQTVTELLADKYGELMKAIRGQAV